MAENAQAMAKPEAAFTIVDRLVALTQLRTTSGEVMTRYATVDRK